MTTVGIRHLKAHLSAYLKQVEAGEHVTVTDRGRAVAVLAPVGTAGKLGWLQSMVAEGRAAWDGGRPLGLTPRVKSRGKPTSRMVLEDRR
ncbi:MAG TPA: type II toxin-antitoxin system prevent-host-death family antitoxin [Vicinamibacterales bacterium]|nr:type II toxin-antitoxin system prevent-host-death family antitoxin [Vicinamibacterales bacterium]